ncbi:unnamed protein product [Blepharisma stoltei]|uniref:Uncharacterized protein n=1 Tax=Blepharisma stoltei TaxID=1481888 RepID=A0AAU9J6Z7_9CILI|nr:unnamed protein product [Blepharisma stoltei]
MEEFSTFNILIKRKETRTSSGVSTSGTSDPPESPSSVDFEEKSSSHFPTYCTSNLCQITVPINKENYLKLFKPISVDKCEEYIKLNSKIRLLLANFDDVLEPVCVKDDCAHQAATIKLGLPTCRLARRRRTEPPVTWNEEQ